MLNSSLITFHCSSWGKVSSLAGLFDQKAAIKHWCFLNYLSSLHPWVSPAVTGTESGFSSPPFFSAIDGHTLSGKASNHTPSQLFSLQCACVKHTMKTDTANQHQWNARCSNLHVKISCLAYSRNWKRVLQALKALIIPISERWEVSYIAIWPKLGTERGYTTYMLPMDHPGTEKPKLPLWL